MFSSDIGYLVSNEKIRDLHRKAEHYRLVKTARLQRPGRREALRKIAAWIQSQVVVRSSKPHRNHHRPRHSVTQQG